MAGRFRRTWSRQIRKGALQMIIFEELVYQDAQKRGMTVAPEKVRQAQAEFRKQFATPAEYKQFLQSRVSRSTSSCCGKRSSARC